MTYKTTTYDNKTVVSYGAAWILAAILVIALVFSTPMILNIFSSSATTGTLLVKLMDAPVDLEELWVNITQLEAHSEEAGWIELAFTTDPDTESPFEWVWVDILTLQNVTMDLSLTEVSPGNYTKLRLQVMHASANFTGFGDALTPLTVPPGKIDIIIRFEVEADQTTELLIDMQADWVAISNSQNLRPVLKATVDSQP